MCFSNAEHATPSIQFNYTVELQYRLEGGETCEVVLTVFP